MTNLNTARLTEISLSVIGAVYNVTTDSRDNLTGGTRVLIHKNSSKKYSRIYRTILLFPETEKILERVKILSIYCLSDLHLSFGTDKPMDIFGWNNHTEQIRANWTRLVGTEDTVVLPGDLSWALQIKDALPDFQFLESLPGRKILLKGNHDLWWVTMKKNLAFFEEHNIKSIGFVYNNCAVAEGYAIAGTRGWLLEGGEADKKVIAREAGRLRRSLESASATGLPILVFLHYPPAYAEERCDELLEILKEFGIKTVYHGHIHGKGFNRAVSECDGISLKLLSSDCIDFVPFRIV